MDRLIKYFTAEIAAHHRGYEERMRRAVALMNGTLNEPHWQVLGVQFLAERELSIATNYQAKIADLEGCRAEMIALTEENKRLRKIADKLAAEDIENGCKIEHDHRLRG